ncbi:class I SAM-dependent methyltransferase [Mucilaginibacter sp. BT774]|uniref:class I SAM-dependent methyltransferase n=1 Tax=Mucilaginibacter sp. BT774 TaxID=3062276 RepID=UPI0026746AAC|nr:class I SAM-dependent methyltransferase [Mucilaginibacter sp. BT774]MDO3626932.1 class I SAM-dependent methyltransferase [Mucilaginibacter sp. BT774]
MAANYDNSAWFYDHLSRLVYGKALVRSQVYLLKHIPANSNILIAGGGTGWILEEIAKVRPSGLTITYAEVSPNMISLSKKRNTGSNKVIFINKPVENLDGDRLYDVLLTPFLFDNFTEETLQKVFAHSHNRLKSGGIWLNTDFRPTDKWWHSFLLKSMIVFFRLICGIEAKKLPKIEKQFEGYQYEPIDQKSFFGEFILSTAYQKLSH